MELHLEEFIFTNKKVFNKLLIFLHELREESETNEFLQIFTIVDTYKLCNEILCDNWSYGDNFTRLEKLCFDQKWKIYLFSADMDKKQEGFLKDMKRECLKRVKKLPEWKKFVQTLKDETESMELLLKLRFFFDSNNNQ